MTDSQCILAALGIAVLGIALFARSFECRVWEMPAVRFLRMSLANRLLCVVTVAFLTGYAGAKFMGVPTDTLNGFAGLMLNPSVLRSPANEAETNATLHISAFSVTSNGFAMSASWPRNLLAAGSFLDVWGKQSLLTSTWELCHSHEVGSDETEGADFSFSSGLAAQGSAFFRLATDADADGDGLKDFFETEVLGTNPNSSDTDGDGFPDNVEYLLGTNPNGEATTWARETESLRSLCLMDPLYLTETNGLGEVVFRRTVKIDRKSPYTQYFFSSVPLGGGCFGFPGMTFSYVDSNGIGETLTNLWSESARRLKISPSTESVTIELRADSADCFSMFTVFLLAYEPTYAFEGVQEVVGPTNETVYVLSDGRLQTGVTFSRRERPGCGEPLSAEELDVASYFQGDDGVRLVVGSGESRRTRSSGSDDSVVIVFPGEGVYDLPGGKRVLVLTPSVSYGMPHAYCGDVIDGDSTTCRVKKAYPLDSECLWRNWVVGGGELYGCSCTPEVLTGIDTNEYPFISVCLDSDERSALGAVKVFDVEVWSRTAYHETYSGRRDVMALDDECDSCSSGCEGGDCDRLDGSSEGSVRFRVSLGSPAAERVSGFLYFDRDAPFRVTPQVFLLMSRSDARVEDRTEEGVRTVVCSDLRGRTLVVSNSVNGVGIRVTDTQTGDLQNSWEITNPSPQAIRFRKISRSDNVMSDETYAFAEGHWRKTDNISGLDVTYSRTGGLNEEGVVEDVRTVSCGGRTVESVKTRTSLIGSGESALLRETFREESAAGGAHKVSYADYWDCPDDARRHGRLRRVRGSDRAWAFYDYDCEGREIMRLEQRDGSRFPGNWDGNVWLGLPTNSATLAFRDYEPLFGDSADPKDSEKVRTESRYATENAVRILIARTWWLYRRGEHNGLPTLTTTCIRACSQGADDDDPGNAVSETTAYADDSGRVPLILRGRTVSSVDEDGVEEVYAYSLSSNVLRTVVSRFKDGVEARTRRVSECDATYGNVIYEATALTADPLREFDRVWRSYDEKNRLRSTRYDDGSSETNAYSCCRLLYTIDRTGAKTLRSATTGRDHLYYAMEEVSLAQLPHDDRYIPYEGFPSDYDAFRVTQHFMDALGRETNVTVRCCKVEGGAVSPSYSCRGWKSHETTRYPDGVSDYSVAVDARGLETTSFSTSFESYEEMVSSNANKTTTVLSYRNGGTVTREDWAGGSWKETELAVDYDDDGCKVETTAVAASDHGRIVTRTVYRDFLGRVVREVGPTSDVSTVYDGAGSRVAETTDAISGLTTTMAYDDLGELIGETRNGVTSRSETTHEVVSNDLWRVDAQLVVAGSLTNTQVVTKERLTGLSDARRGETLTCRNGTLVSHRISSFDPASLVLTEIEESAMTGRTETKSKFGRVIETTTAAGTLSNFFDAYGRVFYSEKDGRSVCWIGRNDAGDVETQEIDYAPGGRYHAEFYGYDRFGNRIVTTNALGAVVESQYDAANRLSGSFGATYPVYYFYDTEGRRNRQDTHGGEWCWTEWTRDFTNGLCRTKTYIDRSDVTYTHTPDGKPCRTTFASGRWRENAYNGKRELSSVSYSDGTDEGFAYDAFSREVCSSNAVAAVVSLRSDAGEVTNELWRVGTETQTLVREYDAFGRLVENDGASYAYAADGQLASVETPEATVTYSYASDREDAGYVLALAHGVTFTRAVTRDAYRRTLITAITNRVGNVVVNALAYAYDALNRPVTRNADTFGYNTRSEVTSATIGGHSANYAYDDIGNSLAYSANNLNQYTEFDYDLDGNLLTDNALDFTYDAANRLKTVSSNGVLLVTNDYDAKSRRVRKVTPEATTTYFYDDWNLVEERIAYDSGATSTIRYHWGKDLSGSLQGAGGVGGLLYLTIDGNVYVPFYDNNGNVTHYCDATGAVVAAYTYDAFGNTLAQSGALAHLFRYRFSTKYYDAESGLYYYGYRFYHPTLMRWLNRDPIEEEGGLNLYGFCDNAMTFLIDTLGKTKYWSNYLNNATTPSSPDVWEKVGGRLFWSFLTIEGYWNSCAIRVSRTLILSGHSISAKAGREKNYDIKADRTVQRAGKSADKGTMLKAESPNARYVIAARNIGDLLDEVLTDSTIRKDSWNSVEEALRKAECIRQEDGEAFFADNGHAGMIKKGYVDPYFPQKSKGRIWRIK